jgi:lipoprotein-anchoring transpeptidase ErfK/SrfK
MRADTGPLTRIQGLDIRREVLSHDGPLHLQRRGHVCAIGLASAVRTASALPSDDRHIVVNLNEQRLYYYRNGTVAFTTQLSTGRRGMPTPRGEFYISDKHEQHTSTIYGSSMPFFLRLSGEAFGIHYGVNPGYPASHGCIRIGSMRDAAYLFQLVPEGTRVTIE